MRYPVTILTLLVLYVSPAYWLINSALERTTAALVFAFWSILFVPAVGIMASYLQWRADLDE